MHVFMIVMGAVVLLPAPVMAQSAKRPFPAKCAPSAGIVAYRGGAIGPRKLGDLPPATRIYAVYNEVDGCPQPIAVPDGPHATPRRSRPLQRLAPRARPAE